MIEKDAVRRLLDHIGCFNSAGEGILPGIGPPILIIRLNGNRLCETARHEDGRVIGIDDDLKADLPFAAFIEANLDASSPQDQRLPEGSACQARIGRKPDPHFPEFHAAVKFRARIRTGDIELDFPVRQHPQRDAYFAVAERHGAAVCLRGFLPRYVISVKHRQHGRILFTSSTEPDPSRMGSGWCHPSSVSCP